ncbi:NAD(+) synthase [Metamycoplasma equirhinis]|uniref:NH(3)-dependent NAD(+) synthetase n=2 Tax=Metamycoplasma equirhinis TaxID=92402 RepID=A0ABZ0PA19_9BACT|nr:NAD(+) synthase [Metamycoplasma equirhinis]TPD98739.1 NAD(+) synthase [Metamycoplasma equirhinis]WPB53715.1 NAD(+) synthase [Metamycoplasma equirhinis]BDX52725.1 NAD(+) synthetase [Metamycoplasma equirhinis]
MELTIKKQKEYATFIKKMVTWLKQKVEFSNSKGISLGISGGIDSATLAKILYKYFPNNSHFYYIKTKDDPINESHINLLNLQLDNRIQIIDLTNEFELLKTKLKLQEKVTIANLKSRFIMATLYSQSQENKTLVLGTDNYDEYYLGYFTKYGDGGCDLLPFANIKKSDVYILANLFDVPNEIINKRPSADLIENQYDEEELGFSYIEFEKWLIDKNTVSKDINQKIINLHKTSEHKRKLIPRGPKIK